MNIQEATEEYLQALKLGQKESKDHLQRGLQPHPVVLDDILSGSPTDTGVYVGLVEIPAERIIGVRGISASSGPEHRIRFQMDHLVRRPPERGRDPRPHRML